MNKPKLKDYKTATAWLEDMEKFKKAKRKN